MSYQLSTQHTISVTPWAHYDFTDLTAGDSISACPDRSGNGHNLIQTATGIEVGEYTEWEAPASCGTCAVFPEDNTTAALTGSCSYTSRDAQFVFIGKPGGDGSTGTYHYQTFMKVHVTDGSTNWHSNNRGRLRLAVINGYNYQVQWAIPYLTFTRYYNLTYINCFQGTLSSHPLESGQTGSSSTPGVTGMMFNSAALSARNGIETGEVKKLSTPSYRVQFDDVYTPDVISLGADHVNGSSSDDMTSTSTFRGKMSEAFIFESPLSPADQIIMDSYTDTRYNLSRSRFVGNNCLELTGDHGSYIHVENNTPGAMESPYISSFGHYDNYRDLHFHVDFWAYADAEMWTDDQPGGLKETTGHSSWYRRLLFIPGSTWQNTTYRLMFSARTDIDPPYYYIHAGAGGALNDGKRTAIMQPNTWAHYRIHISPSEEPNTGNLAMNPINRKRNIRVWQDGQLVYSKLNYDNTTWTGYRNAKDIYIGGVPREMGFPNQNEVGTTPNWIGRIANFKYGAEIPSYLPQLSGFDIDESYTNTSFASSYPYVGDPADSPTTPGGDRVDCQNNYNLIPSLTSMIWPADLPHVGGKYSMYANTSVNLYAGSYLGLSEGSLSDADMNALSGSRYARGWDTMHHYMNWNCLTGIDWMRDWYGPTTDDDPVYIQPSGYRFNLGYGCLESIEGFSDSDFGRYANITYFDMHYNRMTSLEGLQGLKKSQQMNFSYNQISNINALTGITADSTIVNLRLEYNRIRSIPVSAFATAPASLTYLNLENNSLTSVEGLSPWAPGLNQVRLRYQRYLPDNPRYEPRPIEGLPIMFESPAMRTMYIGDNTWADTVIPPMTGMNILRFEMNDTNITNITNITGNTSPDFDVYNTDAVRQPNETCYSYFNVHNCPGLHDNGLSAAAAAGHRISVLQYANLYNTGLVNYQIFQNSWNHPGRSYFYPGRNDIHYAYLPDVAENTPESLGCFKNAYQCCRILFPQTWSSHLSADSLDALFTNDGQTHTRQEYYDNWAFKYVEASYSHMTTVQWLTADNCAGIRYLYLTNTPYLDYHSFAAIAPTLISRKQAGEIRLERIYLDGSLWDKKHQGGGWRYQDYLDTYYSTNLTGHSYSRHCLAARLSGYHYDFQQHPDLWAGLDSSTGDNFYTLCDGPSGSGNNPSVQAQLKNDLYAVGIKLGFSSVSDGWHNYLGNYTQQAPSCPRQIFPT